MGLFRLALADIVAFAREKTLVFILLALGMIASCFCAIYYLTVQYSIESTYGDDSPSATRLYLEFKNDITGNKIQDLLDVLNGFENHPHNPYVFIVADENCYNSMDYFFNKSSRTLPEEFILDPDYKYTYPRGVIGIDYSPYKDFKWPTILQGRELNDSDESVNTALGDKKCKIGEIVSLNGVDFEIVGLVNDLYYSFPVFALTYAKRFIDQYIPFRYIIINFEHKPVRSLINALSEEAKNIDKSVTIYEPKGIPEAVIKSFADEKIKIITIVAFSIIYMFALFRYWIVDSFKKYAVFTICGAGRKSLYLIVCINVIVLVSVLYAAAVGIFYILYKAVKPPDISVLIGITDHIYIMEIITLLALLATVPALLQLRRAELHRQVQ